MTHHPNPDPLIAARDVLLEAIERDSLFAMGLVNGLEMTVRKKGFGGPESMLEAIAEHPTPQVEAVPAVSQPAPMKCEYCHNMIAIESDHEQWCNKPNLSWKARALAAEALNEKFMASVNGPTHMGEPVLPQKQGDTIEIALRILQDVKDGDSDYWGKLDATIAGLERIVRACTAPSAASQTEQEPVAWRAGSEIPQVENGQCKEFILAVSRISDKYPQGRVHVFAANYANNFDDDGCLSGFDDEEYVAHGWYLCGLDTSGEFNEVYEPITLNEGDAIVGWQPLPAWAIAPQAADSGISDERVTEVETFLEEVRAELMRARAKFPGDRIMTIALAEEFGELCKAVLDESASNVRKEAVQTAVMCARVVLDGDGSVVDWRRERGLDQLIEASK